jgi:hypothetical protein
MALDELALSAQRGVDRLIRRLRRGAAPLPTHRRLLVVQILHGGSAYGCVFTGSANNNLFSS